MSLNIIYYGDGPWAHKALKMLLSGGFKISLVVVRNDHKDPELIKIAKENNIESTWHENVNSEEFLDVLKKHKPNLGISMSFNQIFRDSTLNFFEKGVINCHAGKLPYYRGRNILNWALINDEKEVGVTCHYVDKGIDTGDIILQKCFDVSDEDDYGTLLKKAIDLCPTVLYESVQLIQSDEVKRKKQPTEGTYFIQRKIGDELVNWNWSSRRVFCFVRAITTPGPLAQTYLKTSAEPLLIRIEKCKMVKNAINYICAEGAVIGVSPEGNPLIKTGDNCIELTKYSIESDLRKKLRVGDRLFTPSTF